MMEVKIVNRDEKDKLRVLLGYWIKHNKEHGDEFREWAERTKSSGEAALHKELIGAVEEIDRVNASLARALESLDGG